MRCLLLSRKRGTRGTQQASTLPTGELHLHGAPFTTAISGHHRLSVMRAFVVLIGEVNASAERVLSLSAQGHAEEVMNTSRK